jgi:hypothetical protein
MKKLIMFVFGLIVMGATKNGEVWANEKYTTIINPVRSRELWKDKSLKPIEDQHKIIKENNFKATWLLQNDVLQDEELITKIKEFDDKQELGIFLEISRNLALRSRIYFDEQRPWYDPGVVFLSAYNREDRVKLIDKMMVDFKDTFGYRPKSVGAWWIDSYSQQYLENKYGIKTILICSDQKTTDSYGIWGQWWGYPYFPSKDNIIAPGKSEMLVLQWALRDTEKAFFGEGPLVSNFSMQANDYISQGLDINYFEKLATIYLDEKNKLGQITVGLETGIESVPFINEYKKQLDWIKNNEIKTVTMSEMTDEYKRIYEGNPEEVWIGDWKMTGKYRENKKLREKISYEDDMVFKDYYEKDDANFLNRIYSPENLTKKKIFDNKLLINILIMAVGLLVIIKYKKKGIILVILVLTMCWMITHVRYSVVDGQRLIGFLIDEFRFVGINMQTGIVNTDLSNLVAKSMLKIKL